MNSIWVSVIIFGCVFGGSLLGLAIRTVLPGHHLNSDDLSELRWLLFEQLQTSLPPMFLVVLLFWATILFVCFGLLAPRNGTVIAVFLVCAISVAGAIFLILEMEKPLKGAMKLSSAPLVKTLERLGK